MATMPTRIDQELFEAAKAAGAVSSRSAAQQLDHWARIGRELEASPSVTHDQVTRVLASDASYDELGDRAQAIVRASWERQMNDRIGTLDFEAEFEKDGVRWAEADADGKVVIRDPQQS